MTFNEIEQEIMEVIYILSQPTTIAEGKDGWRQEIKDDAKRYFEDVLKKLVAKEALPPLGIARSLNNQGVTGGSLLERIAGISIELQKV